MYWNCLFTRALSASSFHTYEKDPSTVLRRQETGFGALPKDPHHFVLEHKDTLERFYILKSSSVYKLQTDGSLIAEDLYPMAQYAQSGLRLQFNKQITKEEANLRGQPIFPIKYMRDELEKATKVFQNG